MAKFTTIADFTRRLRIPDRSPDNTLMTPMQAKTDIESFQMFSDSLHLNHIRKHLLNSSLRKQYLKQNRRGALDMGRTQSTLSLYLCRQSFSPISGAGLCVSKHAFFFRGDSPSILMPSRFIAIRHREYLRCNDTHSMLPHRYPLVIAHGHYRCA